MQYNNAAAFAGIDALPSLNHPDAFHASQVPFLPFSFHGTAPLAPA
jgi:hypothetical protein